MRVTLARAGPVCLGFDCDLATFGFPFAQARARGAKRHEGLASLDDVVEFVASGTSIGDGGEAFRELAGADRFKAYPFPQDGRWPEGLGRLVATTPDPMPGCRLDPLDVARELAADKPQLLLFGLGPRGLPPEVLGACKCHLEITGKGVSMETATAMGALPAMVRAHLHHLEGRR